MYPKDRCRKIAGITPKKDFYDLHKGECDEYNLRLRKHGIMPVNPDALLPALEKAGTPKRKP